MYNMEGNGAAAQHGFYAATICVPKKQLYASVKALQKVWSVDPVCVCVCERACKPWKQMYTLVKAMTYICPTPPPSLILSLLPSPCSSEAAACWCSP